MKAFAVGSCGATAIEYALIAALISIVIAGGANMIGANLSGKFSAVVAGFQ